MADINLKNLARMTVSSSGTGTITLNAAVSGFLTFDLAGCSTAAAGTIVRYAVADTTQSEIAYGTYTSSSLTLTRGSSTTGMKSTNSNSPINMSNAAQVFITDSDADHPIRPDTNLTSGTLSLNMTFSGTANFTSTTTIGTLVLTTVGAHAITGAITYGGVTLNNAVTGTGNMVLSASPTLTGVMTVAAISGSGAIAGASLTATGLVSGGSAGGTMIATQADLETATSTTTLIAPGRIAFSPFAAKAWVKFSSDGTILASINVTSVTDNGTGNWTVNFTSAFSTANYAAIITLHNDVGLMAVPSITSQLAGSCTFTAVGISGGTVDGTVSCVFYGDR